MNNPGLGGGFLSGYKGGILGMNRYQQQVQSSNINAITSSEQHDHGQPSLSVRGRPEIEAMGVNDPCPQAFTINFEKGKTVGLSNNTSDEDELSPTEDGNGENGGEGKGKKGLPWQRMKWTDRVVRLLIHVVACVGDDGSFEAMESSKRKSGCFQKKGKWKTVSKIMISKGCNVSPQQCEDKFNDLNKRYKKLNDILGRGNSCQVVENPTLMDSMAQLSSKDKQTVKKILSSKHLFYREMCAYHNGQQIPDCDDLELLGQPSTIAEQCCEGHSPPVAAQCSKEHHASEEDSEENDESEDDESEHEDNNNAHEDVEGMEEYGETRRMNEDEGNMGSRSAVQESFLVEIANFFQDRTKSKWEQKAWIKKRMLQLEEEKIGINAEALELEKRRCKWQRFCSKKNSDFEQARLEKEKLILENERMALQLRQKEVDIECRNPELSPNPAAISKDGITRKRTD